MKGFSINTAPRVVWEDMARAWQKCEFGGDANHDPVALRARNRLLIVESAGGSLAIFPPPHKFFFAREIELNLGYDWYRKDDDRTFSAGVRQAEHEEEYPPFGVSDTEWQRRVAESRQNLGNFALYSLPAFSRYRDRHSAGVLTPLDRGRENVVTFPLPPNRGGGSPASGSPAGGFTSKSTGRR